MDPKKVYAIWDWAAPSTITELGSFFGLENYYRRFIEGYSKKATPLSNLLNKNQCWDWSRECQLTFDKLRRVVTVYFGAKIADFEKSFEEHIDASDKAVGGVLVQEGHLVAFESRKLSEAE
jgi:hypothetical protein